MIVPGRDVTRPLTTFPAVLSLIIAVNVAVFMIEVAAGESFIERWALMDLYEQPAEKQPSVEYIPARYPSRPARPAPARNENS